MTIYFAPGKVVVLGEYAVLDGAPALVAAVDHGVRCTVTPSEHTIVETPDADDRFVAPALAAAQAPARRYRFADDPSIPGPKLGLGGSAAATVVAVLAALAERGAPTDPASLRAIAAPVHHRVQGSGSGLDIAASCYGGLIEVRGGAIRTCPTPDLPMRIVSSGRPARTGPRVQRYLAWRDRGAFVDRSTALVEAFERDPIGALRDAYAALCAMADEADLDYLTPELATIARFAAEVGGAAKPSGAGGGDIAIAVLPDVAAADRFAARCASAGLPPISARITAGASAPRSL